MSHPEVEQQLHAPVVKQELNHINTIDGGQAKFITHIEGLPRPTISWYRDDELIQPSEEFEIAYSEEHIASLFIHDVLPEDAGTYVVVAENEVGSVKTTAQLQVEGKHVAMLENIYSHL